MERSATIHFASLSWQVLFSTVDNAHRRNRWRGYYSVQHMYLARILAPAQFTSLLDRLRHAACISLCFIL
jgi:hypothetical protein